MSQISQDEFDSLLEQHLNTSHQKLDLSARVMEGIKFPEHGHHHKIDFTKSVIKNCDWRGVTLIDCDFTEAEFYSVNLSHADLSGSELKEVRLFDVVLNYANLSEVQSLEKEELNQLSLEGAKLPARFNFDKQIGIINQKIKGGNILFLFLYSLLAFSWLAFSEVSDLQLIDAISNRVDGYEFSNLKFELPIIRSSIRLSVFKLIVPLAILIVYIYFVAYSVLVWQQSVRLPALLPDGSPSLDNINHWICGGFLLLLTLKDRVTSRRYRIVIILISFICNWIVVPMFFLYVLWRHLIVYSVENVGFYAYNYTVVIYVSMHLTATCAALFSFDYSRIKIIKRRGNFMPKVHGHIPTNTFLNRLLVKRRIDIGKLNINYFILISLSLVILFTLFMVRDTMKNGPVNFSAQKVFEVDFSEKKLNNSKWTKAVLVDTYFNHAKLNESVFVDSDMKSVYFKKAVLSNAKMDYSKLENVHFDGAEITNASFIRTTLNGVSFKETIAHNISFLNATLKDVNFDHSWLDSADFSGADYDPLSLCLINSEYHKLRPDTLGDFLDINCKKVKSAAKEIN